MSLPIQSHILHPCQYSHAEEGHVVIQSIIAKDRGNDCAEVQIALVQEQRIFGTGPRRIIVRDAGGRIHLSLNLTPQTSSFQDSMMRENDPNHRLPSIMCLARFSDIDSMGDNKTDPLTKELLCVLSSSTTIHIFDVFGGSVSDGQYTLSTLTGGEGHVVPLPCQARAIFPLENESDCNGGLLIQRAVSLEDEQELLGQFPVLRTGDQLVGGTASLLSLHHPLKPALPVVSQGEELIKDVFEQILWVGQVETRDKSSQNKDSYKWNGLSRTICVTYHSQWKRHGFWVVQRAAIPPPAFPVWQWSRWETQQGSHGKDSVADQLPPSADDLLPNQDDSIYDGVNITRQEALADALGVARRPSGVGAEHNATTPPFVDQGVTSHYDLHPALEFSLLLEEDFGSSEEAARKVFLIQNEKGTNRNVIGLLKGQGNGSSHMNLWECLEGENCFLVPLSPGMNVVDVEPVQAIPEQTDLVTVNPEGRLQLFRTNRFVASVNAIDKDGKRVDVLGLSLSCQTRFTCETSMSGHQRCDCDLSLASPLVEQVLVGFNYILNMSVTGEGSNLSMCLRVDTVRLIQADRNQSPSDAAWKSLSALIKIIFKIASRRDNDDFNSDMEQHSSWYYLLKSNFHLLKKDQFDGLFARGENAAASRENPTTLSIPPKEYEKLDSPRLIHGMSNFASVLEIVFDWLHFTYEDCKLRSSAVEPRMLLGRLLLELCEVGGAMKDYEELILRDFGVAFGSGQTLLQPHRWTKHKSPPNIMLTIENLVRGENLERTILPFQPVISAPTDANSGLNRTRLVLLALMELFRPNSSSDECDFGMISKLIELHVVDMVSLISDLPIGAGFLFQQCLDRCRHHPQIFERLGDSAEVWKLLGRRDLECQVTDGKNCATHQIPGAAVSTYDVDKDGLIRMVYSSALRFRTDNRMKEAARLLRSSRSIFLKVARDVGVSDHDFERLKQERLSIVCRRQQALSLGRGMMTYNQLSSAPSEPLPIPVLNLTAKIPPTNATLYLDRTAMPAGATVWPEFHNGVAAGLRLPKFCQHLPKQKIDRSWIISNRFMGKFAINQPNQNSNNNTNEDIDDGKPSHAHGGLLLALGIRGHLDSLAMTDLYNYLTQGTVTTSVGILLGMAAAKRGSCDPAVSKMLCLHIPSLLPPSFSSIEISGPAHAAAITAIGLLYQGSGHRLMTEFLLNELGRKPVQDSNDNGREAYTLSCGFALGLINLARPDDGANVGLSDLDIEARLNKYVIGGLDSRVSRDRADRWGQAQGAQTADSERCSRISEGAKINNDVTAPGAILTLALMYMKSENKTVAKSLELPDTHFLLEYLRPDFCMLRIIARTLILWDNCVPTYGWIQGQIPSVIRKSFRDMKKSALRTVGLTEAEYDRQMGNSLKDQDILEIENKNELGQSSDDQEVDRATIRQINAFCIAGACFGMGLRYAGTANTKATHAISACITSLRDLRDDNGPVSVALRPAERPILELCLGLCAISLSLVNAGTGDLDCFRTLKVLRWYSDPSVSYGNHLAYSAAIGMLFLGGGACTVGRSCEDLAALLLAFYPRFSAETTDNQFYLQALRHFYALAVKDREVSTIETSTGKPVATEVQVGYEKGGHFSTRTFKSPFLLANTRESPVSLSVRSEKYFPIKVPIHSDGANRITLFVQEREPTKDLTKFASVWSPSSDYVTTRDLNVLMNTLDIRTLSGSSVVNLELCRNVRKWRFNESTWNMRIMQSFLDCHSSAPLSTRYTIAAWINKLESKIATYEEDGSTSQTNPSLMTWFDAPFLSGDTWR